MKKIGILTLFDPINYGACLQTYALRAFLEQCGFDAQVIDYRPQSGNVDKRTSFQKMRSYIWKNTLYKLLCDKKRLELTEQFKKDNIQYTADTFYSIEEMDRSCNYDALIVGSDQVWNPQFSGNDKAWFLEFGTASLRLAYAASFGVSRLDEIYWEPYRESLEKINAISVREETGAEIIQNLIRQEVPVVVDPVFLIRKEQWERIGDSVQRKKYILCYYMQGDVAVESEIFKVAKRYAREHHCEILNIGKRDLAKIKVWEPNAFGMGPKEFLGLICNAEAVVTNSFHGTAFSLMFEKPFVSVVNTDRNSLSSRIVDLLTRIDMQSNIKDIQTENEVIPKQISKRSKTLLQVEIEKGKRFLLDVLKEGEKSELV